MKEIRECLGLALVVASSGLLLSILLGLPWIECTAWLLGGGVALALGAAAVRP